MRAALKLTLTSLAGWGLLLPAQPTTDQASSRGPRVTTAAGDTPAPVPAAASCACEPRHDDTPRGVKGVAAPPENYGVSGEGPIGVYGRSADGHGVYGVTEETLPWAAEISGVTGLHAPTGNSGRLGTARSGGEGYSADRYGLHGETRSGYAVIGEATGEKGGSRGVTGFSFSSEGVGVYGEALSGSGGASGVVGETHSPDGVGVRAVGSGARGTALELERGGIRVAGAGNETQTPVFLLEAAERNGCGRRAAVYCAFMDNVLVNGRPDALLWVTPVAGRAPVNVRYGAGDDAGYCPKDRWRICTDDESVILGRKFFVLAVLP